MPSNAGGATGGSPNTSSTASPQSVMPKKMMGFTVPWSLIAG